MPKNGRIIFLLLLICVFLIACSNRSLVTNIEREDEKSIGETYGFTTFNVSFDTKEMKEALVSKYEEKTDKTEASYENKIDNIFLHGNKAMEKLDELFTELDLDAEMDDEDVVKETSKAFEVIDYTTMKLTVKFKGHDTKELMMSK